jgi:hypothetical protein
MKHLVLKITAVMSLLLIARGAVAQDFDNPLTYLSFISKNQRDLSVKYLSYMSAASHGRSMRKVEKRRADLINSIYETRVRIYGMPTFRGDKQLRDSAVSYLKILYSVFNEDYGKIVNMEEIAEQSYDNMEAYLMAQQKAGERLQEAHAAYGRAEKAFAASNNIKLVDKESELAAKLETIDNLSTYYNEVYLTFFKAYKQEVYLVDAVAAKNTNAIEQNRSALLKYAQEGMEKLGKMKGFNSDRAVEAVCRQLMQFYKDEAEKAIPKISDFLLKMENFETVKKSFESAEKTKESVDNYNKAVDDMNRSSVVFNNTSDQLNSRRSEMISSYNETVKTFMDTYMPYK